ncbi:MAG: DUF1610 domain-containing protein [Nanoarchaeota archaeon]|nr:DUF1610 domain-containing protein [Nanoarchaeota archaeon]
MMTENIINDPGSVRFKCPNCGKTEILRTKHQRETVVRYKCHECGFEGPN